MKYTLAIALFSIAFTYPLAGIDQKKKEDLIFMIEKIYHFFLRFIEKSAVNLKILLVSDRLQHVLTSCLMLKILMINACGIPSEILF
jgi:hypothetical protein